MSTATDTRDTEFTRRWNAITAHRSLTRAAEDLGIKRGTLTKWYHQHRDQFPQSLRAAIRANTGRYAQTGTGTGELEDIWVLRKPTEEDLEDASEEVRSPTDFVDALFQRWQELKNDNERLLLENRKLKQELAAGRGVSNQHSPFP